MLFSANFGAHFFFSKKDQRNEAHQSDVIKESRRRLESNKYKFLLSVLKSKDRNLDFIFIIDIQEYAMHLIFKGVF